MTRPRITSIAVLPAALALLLLAASAAPFQNDSGQPKPAEGKKVEDKKALEKKPAPKTIEARFKVSIEGGGELPPNLRVAISGQEKACGTLASEDVSAAVDSSGYAVFKDLPVCHVTVKVKANLFLPLRTSVDLASYKSPIALTLVPEQ